MANSQINPTSVQINIHFSKLKPLQSLAGGDKTYLGGRMGTRLYFY